MYHFIKNKEISEIMCHKEKEKNNGSQFFLGITQNYETVAFLRNHVLFVQTIGPIVLALRKKNLLSPSLHLQSTSFPASTTSQEDKITPSAAVNVTKQPRRTRLQLNNSSSSNYPYSGPNYPNLSAITAYGDGSNRWQHPPHSLSKRCHRRPFVILR